MARSRSPTPASSWRSSIFRLPWPWSCRTWHRRSSLGLVLLVSIADARRRRPGGEPRHHERLSWPLLLGFGGAIAVANASLFLAIKHLPVAVAMVLQNLAPAFVIGWGLLVARRRPRPRVLAGLLVALTGVALVVQLPTTPLHGLNLVGIGFGLATAVGVAAFSVLGARASRRYGAIRANSYAFGVSATAWIIYQLPHGLPVLAQSPRHLPGVIAVAVLGTLVPFVLYAWGTARVGSAAGAMNICLEPVFSAVLAWTWLGQVLDAVQITGGVVLIAAILYLQWSTAEPSAGLPPVAAPSVGRSGPVAPSPPGRPV
ncbi:EamA family transporter [Micromonospora sonneratiae]|uniref:DMT family transporter n=1 Tax=Micromonospora sonneratiae TaxID=1184706 RepID=A0ABW3YPU9_9ACTN